jgi:hypothetical protein
MRPQHLAAGAAALFTLACAENPLAPAPDVGSAQNAASFSRAAARPYTFTQLDVPGAFQTIPSGINAEDVVGGWYFSGTGCPAAPCVVKGFVYRDGVFTTVVYHNAAGTNAALTQVRGVGPDGTVVGSYRMPGEPAVNAHGFILTTDGQFIPVDFPGHTNTIPQRILPDGTIFGCYHDTDQSTTMHGMSFGRNGFSALDTAMSMHNGGTPSGRTITGLFTDMTGKGRAYVLEGDEFTPFDAPSSSGTAAWDMNPSGAIVGFFQDAAAPNSTHGFVLDHSRVVAGAVTGEYTTIDFPVTPSVNAAYTDVFGINAAGDIVGKYRVTATGPFHGYVATRKGE